MILYKQHTRMSKCSYVEQMLFLIKQPIFPTAISISRTIPNTSSAFAQQFVPILIDDTIYTHARIQKNVFWGGGPSDRLDKGGVIRCQFLVILQCEFNKFEFSRGGVGGHPPFNLISA